MKPTIQTSQAGFTRLELAAVVSTVALLAGLLLTTAGVDRQSSQIMGCRANLRQLTRAWSLYALDNHDRLPVNSDNGAPGNWCGPGFLDFTSTPQNWNPAYLTNALLWRSASDPDYWNCPGDPATVKVAGQGDRRRIRSYSMNASVGSATSFWSPGYRTYIKTTDLTAPGPDRTYILLDEHPDSINDGSFAVSMDGFGGSPSLRKLIDFPGSHHLGSGDFSFGDGHVETWKWLDGRTKPPYKPGGLISLNVPSPNNPDVLRIQAATTARP